MFEATLSIDLGAAYTKVAFRRGCEPKKVGTMKEVANVLVLDESALIPSLAIQTQNAARSWVFGWQAAKLNPGQGMKIFKNWKADLFRSENGPKSAAAVIVAEHFFGWLGKRIEAAGIDLSSVQTRVAMPAFESYEEKALVVALCMEMNGWGSPLILKATEPHANSLGLFSCGRNVVLHQKGGDLVPDYGKMFGAQNPWMRTARSHTLFESRTNIMTAAIVDIGAFTTDIASLTFDVTAPDDELGDGLQEIRQVSHALGVIDDLDQPLLKELGNRRGVDLSDLRFEEAEMLKQALYGGGEYTVALRPRGSVTLGCVDRAFIDASIQAFESAVWQKVDEALSRTRHNVVFLTGGGSMIPSLAEGIKRRLKERKIESGLVPDSLTKDDDGAWRPWEHSGEGMHRLATAVGGASVVMQTGQGKRKIEVERAQVTERIWSRTDAGYDSCRCQGGNKDCCFCGGRGFYRRR